MNASLPKAAVWSIEDLDESVQAVLEHAGLIETGTAHEQSPGLGSLEAEQVAARIFRKAERLGCTAMPVETTRRELRNTLRTTAPALLALSSAAYLAIAEVRRGRLYCLQRDGTIFQVDADEVCRGLETSADRDRRERLARLLNRSAVHGENAARAVDSLMDDTAGQGPFHGLWVFRAASGRPAGRWIKDSGVLAKSTSLFVAHFAQYALWLGSWALLGRLSFAGHMDRAWLVAWALLLATVVPCRALATWLQGVIPILLGGELKRRVLEGAMKLTPDEVRTDGIGAFLGQALETEALESLALGGGIVGLLALVDLAVCSLVLGNLALLMVLWLLLSVAVAVRFLRKFGDWSGERLAMTQDLVEAMVGQRTRLAQLPSKDWHHSEDEALNAYLGSSQRVDRVGAVLVAAIPRGWLLVAFAFLAPEIVSGQTSAGQLATAVGGTLLGFTAFDRLMNSFSEIAAAWVAWKRAGFLFRAAARPDTNGALGTTASPDPGVPVLEADHLEFRYRHHGPAVLQSCNLRVWRGDRILLEGASGSGKTTLASLLSGTRKPHAGLLLSGGLDIHSLGEPGWRDRIVSAPQFHDNHILTETLAFNLLMGKHWPASVADFEEAEEVCRRLGLGNLLDRMPSGLLQMVGDGGWQLSHGERSRVFVARALLQNPELIILDESFGSLDPETLHSALEYTLERAQSLVVIAHP